MNQDLIKLILIVPILVVSFNIGRHVLEKLFKKFIQDDPKLVFMLLGYASMVVSAYMCLDIWKIKEVHTFGYITLIICSISFIVSVVLALFPDTKRFKYGVLIMQLFDVEYFKPRYDYHTKTIYINEVPTMTSTSLIFTHYEDTTPAIRLRKDINATKICKSFLENNRIEENDINKFHNFLTGKKIESKISIISQASRSKEITYNWLFDFLNEYVKGGILQTFGEDRKELLLIIQNNFSKRGENFIYKNLESRYCDW